jgi:hypothetical protein
MGIKIGDVDVASQIMESEYRIGVLERVIDLLLTRFPSVGGPPVTAQEMDRIRQSVVEQLQKKYPSSGISLVGGRDGQ